MILYFIGIGCLGYYIGHARAWASIRQRIDHAEQLIRSLKSFVFVAKSDGRRSPAVDFADQEIQQYEEKWK